MHNDVDKLHRRFAWSAALSGHCFFFFFLSQPEVSHSFPPSMFAHTIRLHVWACAQTPPSAPSIIVTERQQFSVLVPLSVFQDGSHVKHFPVNSKYCWLYVSCKLEQMNHRASEKSQTGEKSRVPHDITPVFSLNARHLNWGSSDWRSNYAAASMRTFIVCFQVLTQNLVCWVKLNLSTFLASDFSLNVCLVNWVSHLAVSCTLRSRSLKVLCSWRMQPQTKRAESRDMRCNAFKRSAAL